VEIAQIVAAWYRGEIVPRSAAPTVAMLLGHADWREVDALQSSEPVPPPVEIVGGVSGLQKHLIKLAEKNCGLDHATLKQLFDKHEVVVAVWPAETKTKGPNDVGFLTLKGTDHLLAQIRRGTKKLRATMTAIPCNNQEHAQLLQQAFSQRSTGAYRA
jgi:hypothetical protein